MSQTVTITLTLPGRSRAEALRKAGEKLTAAAWEDYPDRIQQARSDREMGYASTLAARCDLLESLGRQFREAKS